MCPTHVRSLSNLLQTAYPVSHSIHPQLIPTIVETAPIFDQRPITEQVLLEKHPIVAAFLVGKYMGLINGERISSPWMEEMQ